MEIPEKDLAKIIEKEEEERIKLDLKTPALAMNLHDDAYFDYFFPTKKEKESLGARITNRYQKLFRQSSVANDTYASLTLHLILGQIFRKVGVWVGVRENDLRVSTFIIQDSGSGKSTAVDFIKTVSDRVGVPFYIVTGEVNETALVGSVSKDKKGNIVKKAGLMEKFKGGGILWFDEGRVFITSEERTYNIHILSYVQTALNPIGSHSNIIRRVMKEGTIEYPTEVSFGWTTYPIQDKMLNTLRKGFFQRAPPFCRRLSKEDWKNVGSKVVDLMAQRQMVEDEDKWKEYIRKYNLELKKLVDDIISLKNWITMMKIRRVTWVVGVKEELEKVNEEVEELIGLMSGEVKDIFNSFRLRTMIDVHKFAVHRALLDKRTKIEIEDVEYAKRLVLDIFKSLVDSIESLDEVVQRDTIAMQRWRKLKRDWNTVMRRLTFNRDGTVDTKHFTEICAKYFDVSADSVRKYITEWVKKNLLTRIGSGRAGSRLRF